ncbi:hypothetical protein Cgig2_008173 [Carnegiea gigantea]|uniref:Cytochrome P450 n=1 Tax=Carnegiea gigantea TaxID=171969 RepID=A0A9Q1L0W8_9CARY|nr:hypothetical protein Cgig2_008173 [Carnegiea gigantea]
MRSKFTELTFNIIMRMVTGKRYFGEETEGFELEEAIVFRGIARDVFELSGATSMVDWLPFLRWVDFQNLEGRMLSVRKNMDGFLDGLIEECRTKRDCRNIINETLRLFPSVPLLAPHEPSEDCTIAGYHVQRGTMVLINAWAIHRDPNLWEDHSSFRPERFEGVKGEAYRLKLMPFGLGRRACPGAPLAYRVVGLVLATLVQCLDWKKVSEESVDLVEGFGLSMPKATPLKAMFKARQSMINVLEGI